MTRLKQHIGEIIQVNDENFEVIQHYFTLKKVIKNQYLINQGDDAKFEYIIISGIFRVFYLDDEGKEHIVQFATKDWWMSDYIAYFRQKPAKMYVVCMQPGEVLCLTLKGREELSEKFHFMEHFFRVKLTNGYVALQQRVISLLSNNPQQRYQEFAELYPDLMQTIPKKYIAEYLGVSRETLSRLYSGSK